MTENTTLGHGSVSLKDRSRLEADGIDGVISFDEDYVKLISDLGVLNIEGEGLVIESLNKENKRILITGKISGLFYTTEKKKKPVWGRER